jgi:hypothetical protein
MISSLGHSTNKPESLRSLRGELLRSDSSGGLEDKRRFRMYKTFAADFVLKLVFTKPFYLDYQRLWTGQGACVLTISTGGTEGGTFVDLPTKFPLNVADGAVTSYTAATQNGTQSGGTEREVLMCDSGSAGGGTGNGDQLGNRRKLPAGTYYFNGVITGTTSGIYAIEWEELP